GEIAAASNEQAQGIDQINKAVSEMDRVVQQNAANTEETASVSEELHSQAEQMRSFVGELTTIILGNRPEVNSPKAPPAGLERRKRLPEVGTIPKSTRQKALPVPLAKGRGKK
ncbi:MAG: methyl-accepting chemotaxis protein, partial [Desulfobacca sp.]|nr:methyl-accepting chemotaxis protein [Desulfobacca sp.]